MNIAAFASYVFLTAFTPGPNNIMAMTNAARFGMTKALRFCLGVFLGILVDMAACAVGTSILFEYVPAVEPVMKWVGAAYILLLAYVIYRDAPSGSKTGPRLVPYAILTGMVMQFVNVKVILYGITVMSTFVLPYYRSVSAVGGTAVLLAFVGFVSTCCWALFGSLFQSLYLNHRKSLNAVMALMLVCCAVAVLL